MSHAALLGHGPAGEGTQRDSQLFVTGVDMPSRRPIDSRGPTRAAPLAQRAIPQPGSFETDSKIQIG